MTSVEYKMNLWKEFMEHTGYIRDCDREIMGKIAGLYIEDSAFLLKVYEAFVENERFLIDEEKNVRYEREEDMYILSLEGRECIFEKGYFRKVIAGLLDLLEDTLPLGSVVDLRKDVYQNVSDVQNIDHIRLVITYRFLCGEQDSYYFPYAGVVYPTGMLGRKEVLYFTRPLVEKVVKKGYSDEQEDAYVYLMKKELVVEKKMNSFGYAEREDIKKFNKRVKEDGNYGK